MLTICSFLWGTKYGVDDVVKLHSGLKRKLKTPHRFLCMTERERQIKFPPGIERHAIKDPELLSHPGCFARLRLFDPAWQENRKIDGPIVSIDLDVVITGVLDPVFDRSEPFVILTGANSVNPCPYNGSLFLLQPGAHPEVWSDFSLDVAAKIRAFDFPDDQAWFWEKIPKAAGWKAGAASGVFAYQKPGWPVGSTALPREARIVVFPGWRSPAKFQSLGWVRDHWRA